MQTITDCPGPSSENLCAVSGGMITMSPGAACGRSSPAWKVTLPLLDDPRLVVRVAVKSWPATGFAVVEDQRNRRSVIGAREVAVPERLGGDDLHGQPPLRSHHRMHHAR
jgi:hypothetical protein